ELIAFTKARPNEILFSSSGSGSGQHLAMELLNRMAGLQLVHIPYKGTAAGTPKEIVAKLYGEIAKAVANSETRERLLAMGLDPVGMPPDEFTEYVKTETAKWGKLVREAGIRGD